jgi:hypothetical protein
MYQTTATSSPTWAKTPRQDGPYKLAGHEVSKSLFDAKEAAKRQGRRVFLVLLTEHENEKESRPASAATASARKTSVSKWSWPGRSRTRR